MGRRRKTYEPYKPSFSGYGGIPISHVYKWKRSKKFPFIERKGFYFIDRTTSHNIIVGTSRSAKTQAIVIPMIDNLSRAEKQSSIVVNDPKGELYAASSATLRERGYNVYLLNLADGSQSMAYNPLQLIIQSWKRGDIEGAMQLVNSLTYTLYHEENAGANSWVYEGAQKAVNGMIIALIEYCIKHNMTEKITLNNVIDMVNELGTVDYATDPDDPYDKSNVLDEYFKHLKQGSIAKREFGSTSFSGDKAKGSIYSTIVQKLSVFSMPKMARMTSMNSLELKSIGFPKYLDFEVDKSLANKRIQFIFFNKKKEVISKHVVKVAFGGFVQYNFDDQLTDGSYLMIKHGKEFSSYKIKIDPKTEKVQLMPLQEKMPVRNLRMHYSDKPTAVFMKIPDYDSSNNALASIFISQLYSELAKQCSYVAGGKTIRRVHFIFDEFGNMLPIKDMDQLMTVSAGRNMLFTLIIQSYKQIYAKYGKDKGNTIKENGQNQILIKSTDIDTNKEFCTLIGNKTVEGSSVNKSVMNTAQSINVSADSVPLLLPERIKDFMIGESVVLRPLYRQDLKGRSVRPFPIFNTGKTEMRLAYTFLNDEFNPGTSPDLLQIDAPHAQLDLGSLAINWRDWITWSQDALSAYDEHQQADASKQDGVGSDDTASGAKAKQESERKEDEFLSPSEMDRQMEEVSGESDSKQDALFEFWSDHKEELGENATVFRKLISHDGTIDDFQQFLQDDPTLLAEFIELWQKIKNKELITNSK